ncbi:nucleoside 2-deoxyribosyltransferase [Staphylococcus delphini]|uniref:nucleoside 2-deoxyribosyltransferase n=1 Tax=Staphylococcus delphini TaxID=53344 RepID=UPI0023B2F245|nr:nucleoside 2-deoxyribosyltransferase [Staphylococcus delphini]MDE9798908.1 nucleoside 2-deoxyribosyltransferase [Staphylococcus delphini]MDE9806119.1 nucleoside 2-deoxyribosyltransferase [Staphylococcus delphini]
MTKIYLAHSIATKAEAEDSIRVANELRKLGFDVYAAAENKTINDKSNNPTPRDIYEHDTEAINNCDIFVVNLNGGSQDGTISEIGYVAGLNESSKHKMKIIIAYTSNARLLNTQTYNGLASASVNHLVLGMIYNWGFFAKDEKDMFEWLRDSKRVFEND